MSRYKAYSEYKDSGVDWLGEAPSHWTTLPVGRLYQRTKRTNYADKELLSVYRDHGVVPTASRDDNNNKPSEDLTAYQLVEPDNLVMNKMKAWQGSIAIAEYEGIVSPAYFVYEPNARMFDLALPKYIHYLLRHPIYIAQYLRQSKGIRVNQWDLDPDEFKKIELLLPTKEEQKKIIAFLDHETAKIDALIEKQQRLIELLKEKRQAVNSHAATKGLKPNTPMKDSGVEWLGEVPAHWKVKKLKYLVDEPLMYGANEAAIDNNPNNPRFIRITDVNDDGSLRADTFCSLSEGVAAPFLLKEGDVLLARTGGTVGKSFLYANTWGKCCFAGYLIKASLNQQIVLAEWFYQYAQTRYYWDWIDSVQIQATLPNVSAEKYNGFFVPTPPINEQMNIVAEIRRRTDKFDVLIAAAEQTVAYMQERRTALISAAVTGKIDVRDWQAAA